MAWSDQAVLARTHDLLAGVRRALEEAGIPCRFAPAPESPDTEAPGPATGRAAARTRSAGRPDPGGGVELATFHRAKGLEWEAVSVVGLEDGYVPIVHATTPAALDEERRLLYVALTRAGRILECSWARSRAMGSEGRPMDRRPSPWLAGMADVVAEGTGRPTPAGRRRAVRRTPVPAPGLTGLHRLGPTGRVGRRGPRQSTLVSMKTGVWSEGFSPFRAWRSMRAKVVFRASTSVTRRRSMRIPRWRWKEPPR